MEDLGWVESNRRIKIGSGFGWEEGKNWNRIRNGKIETGQELGWDEWKNWNRIRVGLRGREELKYRSGLGWGKRRNWYKVSWMGQDTRKEWWVGWIILVWCLNPFEEFKLLWVKDGLIIKFDYSAFSTCLNTSCILKKVEIHKYLQHKLIILDHRF